MSSSLVTSKERREKHNCDPFLVNVRASLNSPQNSLSVLFMQTVFLASSNTPFSYVIINKNCSDTHFEMDYG